MDAVRRLFADRKHTRVFNPPLNGNGVELLLNSDGDADSVQAVDLPHVILNDAGKGQKPQAADAGDLHHSAVREFTANARRQIQVAEPPLHLSSQDTALTARAIARQLGIHGVDEGSGQRVVTGLELAELSDERLIDTAEQISVFARVTPEQKLRLVRALQTRGQIVAMTGDGVNDAPALKQANIGVAMGISGTEAAKEAADMVLTDDNFASIEAAVEEGRGVFDNLTKFILWTLPTNMGEGLVILAAIFAGVALPILPVQILWINMTTAVLLGLMLAFEPKEPAIMARKPRKPETPVLTGVLLGRIACWFWRSPRSRTRSWDSRSGFDGGSTGMAPALPGKAESGHRRGSGLQNRL